MAAIINMGQSKKVAVPEFWDSVMPTHEFGFEPQNGQNNKGIRLLSR